MRQFALLGFISLAACSTPPPEAEMPVIPPSATQVTTLPVPPPPVPPQPVPPSRSGTAIASTVDAERLRQPSGVTLQWIGWEERGPANVVVSKDGEWTLNASQRGPGGQSLDVRGTIAEIGHDYFILDGTITIENTPDPGRRCQQTKRWHFAVTQNRKYYRLREFEWCDFLTDYVDIYF